MSTENIFVIITIVLVILLIAAIVYFLVKNGSTHPPVTPNNQPLPLLNQPCLFVGNTNLNILGSNGICGTGLICGANGACLADIGTSCSNLTECTPLANTCSGQCLTGPTNELNAFCPCSGSLQCIPQSNGTSVCKTKNGFSCSTDSDCVDQCINGVCSGGLQLGSQCQAGECLPGLTCDTKGFCQHPGITSGNNGAFCYPDHAPTCGPPLVCNDNVCVNSIAGLGANCGSVAVPCNIDLVCKLQPPVPPSTSSDFNVCVFPDNNTCTLECAANFTCRNGICKSNPGQSCNISLNCATGSCVSNNSLFYWNGFTFDNLGTAPSDTYTRMLVYFRTPTQTTPSNVVLVGNSAIHLYDPVANQWRVVISNPTAKGTIIDAAIDHSNNLYYLINTNSTTGIIVTNSNLTPTDKFGTVNGNLIVSGSPVVLNSLDVDINGNLIVTDTLGNLYINSIKQTTVSNAKKARAFGNYPPVQNYAYINDDNGIQTIGQLNNNVFPLFEIGSQNFKLISDYSIHVENSVTVPDSVSAGNSYVYAIASADGVNYSLILNNAAYQSQFPGYVNTTSLVGTDGPDLYLFTTSVCT